MRRNVLPAVPAELRELIRVTAGAFIALILIGYFTQLLYPEWIAPLLNLLLSQVQDALSDADSSSLLAVILYNNLSASFIAIVLGVIPFLRLPVLELAVNALLFGAMGHYYQQSGMSLAAYLAGTLPHGLFEFPALVLSCAAGLYICRAVSAALLRRGDKSAIPKAIGDSLLLYARLIVPLLALSALVEVYITPSLLAAFL